MEVRSRLAPFLARKIEVDLVQIAPLALYNYLCHDRFGNVPAAPAVSVSILRPPIHSAINRLSRSLRLAAAVRIDPVVSTS